MEELRQTGIIEAGEDIFSSSGTKQLPYPTNSRDMNLWQRFCLSFDERE